MTEEQGGRARAFPPNAVHLVRTSQQMQLQLSQMADQKASMLMGATFVVFTLAMGQLRGGGPMLVPLAILAAAAFLSAMFSILTVLPTVTRNRQSPVGEDENLLFFGVFTSLPEGEYIDRVLDRLEAEESTYRTMLRDIHQAGTVMARKKYRFLAYGYRTFLAGMVLTLIAAVAELATGRII